MKMRLLYIGLIAVLALVPSAVSAQAIEEKPQERHCVIQIDPVAPGEKDSKTHNFRCFSTFAEAIASATGGQVALPASVPASKLSDDNFDGPLSSYVVGIDYRDSGYSGDTLVWEAPAPCSPSVSYATPTMPSGWDNKVSSAQAYADCNTWWHYQNTSYGGSQQLCTCSSMGAMNDKTSSETWEY